MKNQLAKNHPSYELIEHTADIGIRVKGGDLRGLFANAAAAMFSLFAEEKPTLSKAKSIKIKLQADNLDELFVNWLNELLSLSATQDLIFSEFQIKKIDKNFLDAKISGRQVSEYKISHEIKAATYHQLKLEETISGWQAEVIFDI